MGWANLIVPIAGVVIVTGVVIVAKPPRSHNRHVNPKTGGRF